MKTATYHFRLSDFRGGYTPHQIKVEIIGESEKSYLVKYLEPGTFGQYAGATKWVRKRNVTDIVEPDGAVNVRTTTAPANIRLPYKD